MTSKRVIAISGSLRRGSLNQRLILAARDVARPKVDLLVFGGLAGVPLFNEDLEAASPGVPGTVRELRALISGAAGLLISTPEYNQSIPGVMKNVVDWLSRPDDGSVIAGKPVAITGATTGPWGTRYAQKELRHGLTAAGAIVMPTPMLFVAHAESAFDAHHRLIDRGIEARLREFLWSFDRWIELLRPLPALVASA